MADKEEIKQHLRQRIETLDKMIADRISQIDSIQHDIERAKSKVDFQRQQIVNLQIERYLLLTYKEDVAE